MLRKGSCPVLWSRGQEPHKAVPRGFSGGSGVKNLPANAEGTGSVPDPGRPHTWNSGAHAPQLLRLGAATTEPISPGARELVLCKERGHRDEKPAHCNQSVAPAHHN